MKQFQFLLAFFLLTCNFVFAQNRNIARGAESGELYLTFPWYGIYDPIYGNPFLDTLRTAIYRLSEHGKKITIQYNADYLSDPPDTVIHPQNKIVADATPGTLYNIREFIKDDGRYTSLWVSFDYGKNWIFREENIGKKYYFATNIEGIIYRTAFEGNYMGTYKSVDYGVNFIIVNNNFILINESGFEDCEFYSLIGREFYYTYDCFQSEINLTIDEEFVYPGGIENAPDVYRGGLPGEVYVSSWFPGNKYSLSFSANTGHTFKHVYINTSGSFMSDREPGVFYILRGGVYEFEADGTGWHIKFYIDHYTDYGETLVATYCHDLHKNYGKTCEAVNDLAAKKINNNILLSWSEPESSLPVVAYHIYRNDELLSVTKNTTYTDENLSIGNYEYYIITYYEMDCISDSSNHIKEEIEVGIEVFGESDGIVLYPNPTAGELRVTSYELQVTNVEIFDIYGRNLTPHTTHLLPHTSLDISHLQAGIYFVKIQTEKGIIIKKIIKH